MGGELEKLVKQKDSAASFRSIPVAPSIMTPILSPYDIKVSSDRYLDENAPAVVIFTSGTTGPPK